METISSSSGSKLGYWRIKKFSLLMYRTQISIQYINKPQCIHITTSRGREIDQGNKCPLWEGNNDKKKGGENTVVGEEEQTSYTIAGLSAK